MPPTSQSQRILPFTAQTTHLPPTPVQFSSVGSPSRTFAIAGDKSRSLTPTCGGRFRRGRGMGRGDTSAVQSRSHLLQLRAVIPAAPRIEERGPSMTKSFYASTSHASNKLVLLGDADSLALVMRALTTPAPHLESLEVRRSAAIREWLAHHPFLPTYSLTTLQNRVTSPSLTARPLYRDLNTS